MNILKVRLQKIKTIQFAYKYSYIVMFSLPKLMVKDLITKLGKCWMDML